MKLAVSSIARNPSQDEETMATLVRRCVAGLEVTPLAYWPTAPNVAPRLLSEYRDRCVATGLSIVALQGVLFGKPELQLFGTSDQRAAYVEHLSGIAQLAGTLGARVVVLGAPRNRLRGTLSEEEAIAVAAPLLKGVAAVAADVGVVVCIEPNPPRYGGDFACTIGEAERLVEAIDHLGFGLHLDAGAIAINGEVDADIVEAAGHARHFHISEVDLAPVGSGTVDHAWLGGLLQRGAYNGWVSVEMTRGSPDALAARLDRAIDIAEDAHAAK